ncbi:MAG: formate dehydrogenase accessory protein FdhE [Desulfobacteraceae bacterium]|nr:MAG: formate dehydrogenase accessory protein FdhE [Desulfobacteraceae bacterium]
MGKVISTEREIFMPNPDLKAVNAKVKYLKNRWPIYSEIIDWMAELLPELYKAEERVVLPRCPWESVRSERFGREIPLFDGRSIPLDMESVRALYPTLVAMTEVRRGKLQGLGEMLQFPPDDLENILRAVLASETKEVESLCSRRGADPSLFTLLMRLAAKPSLRRLSKLAEAEVAFSSWSKGFCPVCGSWPGLARLGEGEKPRTLFCSLCDTSWVFPNLKCPFCENNRPEELTYLFAEEEKDLRLDLCERCGQGLRTFDMKYHAAPVLPLLDELVTSHLVLAAANGAKPTDHPPGAVS